MPKIIWWANFIQYYDTLLGVDIDYPEFFQHINDVLKENYGATIIEEESISGSLKWIEFTDSDRFTEFVLRWS